MMKLLKVMQSNVSVKWLALAIVCSIIYIASEVSVTWSLKILIDSGVLTGDISGVRKATLWYGISLTSWHSFSILSTYAFNALGGNMLERLREVLFKNILHMRYDYHQELGSGYLISTLRDNFLPLEQYFVSIPQGLIQAFIRIAINTIILISFDIKIAIIGWLLIIPLVIIPKLFSTELQNQAKLVEQSRTNIARVYEDLFGGQEILRHGGALNYAEKRLEPSLRAFKRYATKERVLKVVAGGTGIGNVYYWTMVAIIFSFTGYLVIGGHLTPGVAVAITTYIALLNIPAREVVNMFNQIQSCKGVLGQLEKAHKVASNKLLKDEMWRYLPNSEELCVNIRDVSFSYGENIVLNGVNIECSPGTCMAIVGTSGQGKSTLIKVAAGLLPPSEGVVTLCEANMSDAYYLAADVGVVLQDVVFIKGTLYENIVAGASISRDKVTSLCRQLQLNKFINSFERGLDTMIDPLHLTVSGGEQRIIALIRCLVRNPRIIFLDEPTANLSESYRKVFIDLLKEWFKDNPSSIWIISTHDQQIIDNCNKTYKLC